MSTTPSRVFELTAEQQSDLALRLEVTKDTCSLAVEALGNVQLEALSPTARAAIGALWFVQRELEDLSDHIGGLRFAAKGAQP